MYKCDNCKGLFREPKVTNSNPNKRCPHCGCVNYTIIPWDSPFKESLGVWYHVGEKEI